MSVGAHDWSRTSSAFVEFDDDSEADEEDAMSQHLVTPDDTKYDMHRCVACDEIFFHFFMLVPCIIEARHVCRVAPFCFPVKQTHRPYPILLRHHAAQKKCSIVAAAAAAAAAAATSPRNSTVNNEHQQK